MDVTLNLTNDEALAVGTLLYYVCQSIPKMNDVPLALRPALQSAHRKFRALDQFLES